MRIVDIIAKKRDGMRLSEREIAYFVQAYTRGDAPDYQAAALLMAIYLRGMDSGETAALTLEMARSGDMADLSAIPGVKVDKHSTGGVGDKTTLVVGPLVASFGVPVAKMSGRGLGHTGGTIDKLESIPGLRTALTRGEFLDIVRNIGIGIAGQTGNLAPADKKLYALRDVTGTVESLPLIAASVMSKKLAAGADAIVLDVKAGSGAFMKTPDSARALAEEMVRIGESVGRETVALLTNMDVPLGNSIGNGLEVAEAVEVLRGGGPRDLVELCVELAADMLLLARGGELAAWRGHAAGALKNGKAFTKLLELVAAQGGDVSCLTKTDRLPRSAVQGDVPAPKSGIVYAMDCGEIGRASMLLGAGRETKESGIDYGAGIVLRRKTGDAVESGEPLARLYTADERRFEEAKAVFLSAITIRDDAPEPSPLIYGRIDKDTTTDRTRRSGHAGFEQKG